MSDESLPDVHDLYETLFRSDPMLLNEKNQHIFGSQILLNLLVERSISASDPSEVSLDLGSSRLKFKEMALATAQEITQELIDTYKRSRHHRTQLTNDEFSKLKKVTMVVSANYTADRITEDDRPEATDQPKIIFQEDGKAREELKNTGSPLDGRLKIATIGYRISISRIPNGGLLGEELAPRTISDENTQLTEFPEKKSLQKLRRTKLRPGARHDRWFKAILRHIKLALARQSHFVVLPEFALPPDLCKSRSEIEEAINTIAKDSRHEFFLFAGSRHEGVYNRGFILSRGVPSDIARRDPKSFLQVTDVWWHYKVASARSLGENIMGPQNAKLPGYNFTLTSPRDKEPIEFRIFVAICYDVFDATTFINYVVQCADAQSDLRETIILVPSFNPAKEFVDALRDLSFIASCPVIYVNGLHGDAKVFLYGFAVADLTALELPLEKQTGLIPEFDRSLSESQQTLRNEISAARRRYRAAVESSAAVSDPAIKREIFDVSRSIYRRREILEKREEHLDRFCSDLQRLRSQGALKHLITTEQCEHCTQKSHSEDDEYCPRDVVYYNIDLRLIRILAKFRNDFFAADDFLPLPFRTEEKKKIFDKIRKRKEKRAAQTN